LKVNTKITNKGIM